MRSLQNLMRLRSSSWRWSEIEPKAVSLPCLRDHLCLSGQLHHHLGPSEEALSPQSWWPSSWVSRGPYPLASPLPPPRCRSRPSSRSSSCHLWRPVPPRASPPSPPLPPSSAPVSSKGWAGRHRHGAAGFARRVVPRASYGRWRSTWRCG